MKHLPYALTLLVFTPWARAHEGHGLPGSSHWHAGDAWLVLALAAAVGAAIWLRSRK